MTETDLVRTSRDGDQFHYLWAARRCLKLLLPNTRLVAISIEGGAIDEAEDQKISGDEIIDVAEYYGSTSLKLAEKVTYYQLKHSTVNATEPWTVSDLKKTLSGFYLRFLEIKKLKIDADLTQFVKFVYVSNRVMPPELQETFSQIAVSDPVTSAHNLKYIKQYTACNTDDELKEFCQLFDFECNEDYFTGQEQSLIQEFKCYLPDNDADAPIKLKDMVAQRATTKGAKKPEIDKTDVTPVEFIGHIFKRPFMQLAA